MEQHIELIRLKEFKEESGWSFAKIARCLNLHPQTLMWWWTDTHRPSTLAREKIRAFLEEYSYKKGE
ncbi:hypothetical protein ES703_17439 [subsurface metagenome]